MNLQFRFKGAYLKKSEELAIKLMSLKSSRFAVCKMYRIPFRLEWNSTSALVPCSE